MSDIFGEENSNDGFLIIGGIISVFLLFIGIIYLWQVHREKVKKLGCVLLGLLVIYLLGCMLNLIKMVVKNRDRVIEPIAAEPMSEEPMSEEVYEPQFTESYSKSSDDSWSSYPPATGIDCEGKDNDFLVTTTNNPSFRIYDLMLIGELTIDNTQFLSESEYTKSKWVREHYTPQELHEAYRKLSSAWQIFYRWSGVDVSDHEIGKYFMHYDMFDIDKPQIDDAPNPQLIKDLKVVPLH